MDSIFSRTLFEASVTNGTPCGGNLEYSPMFTEFTALSTAREERQIGGNIIPAQDPDWASVFKTGCSLLEQSRDLRILAMVCRAALHQYGLPGLAQALSLMKHWIGSQWEHLHPVLYIDDDYDPLFRSNAIASLSDPEGLVRSLRQAVFLDTPIGTVTVSVADRLLNGKPVEDQTIVTSLEQLSRMLVEEKDRNQERFSALASIQTALSEIASTFREQLESEYWPDIGLLTDIVARLERFVATNLQQTLPQAAEQPEQNAITDSPVPSTPIMTFTSAGLPAALQSRSEAFKALALARAYFESNEPSHPAPLLIRRVERLADMDFFAIVKDLTPEGLQQLQLLAGDAANSGH